MIEEFICRSLILGLGYAYPAYLCYKTLEKNRVGIQELRFWCQYWIIVAVLTVLEKFCDVFIFWLPMYRGMKLALFIYLWHPNTKGSDYVYEAFLRPYFLQHEMDIDRSLFELKERAINFAIYYWHNCSELGTKKILQFFQFVVSQYANVRLPSSQLQNGENHQSNVSPTPPSTPSGIKFKRNISDKRRPPPGPSAAPHLSQTPRSDSIKVRLHSQTQFIHPEDIIIPDPDIDDGGLDEKSDGEHVDGDKIKSH